MYSKTTQHVNEAEKMITKIVDKECDRAKVNGNRSRNFSSTRASKTPLIHILKNINSTKMRPPFSKKITPL